MMIDIGAIDFKFRMKDEDFTRDMYSRWDNFYRDILHEIVEGVLSRHDRQGELIRLEKLELNLGDIPQKDFYRLFPVRLKEELERIFSYQSMQTGSRESVDEKVQRRLASLIFYLEKGFCPTVWENAEFNLEQEMRFLLTYAPHRLVQVFHETTRHPNQLCRMVWGMPRELLGRVMLLWLEDRHIQQVEKEMRLVELEKTNSAWSSSLQKVVDGDPVLSGKISSLLEEEDENYMSWLLSTTISVYEKRRFLARLLDTKPVVVIHFIHETPDEKSIRSLAGLLDKVMVRQIIDKESENHTEVDVPAYWMYLYNWLIKNYPFNGVYMFGNKMQFKEYLNVKLLHFIRKRSYSAYLSKAELTVQFLIEVFGHEYYLDILNIIYNQQERNEDGSPVYTGYFNMELYHMFMHLSLLRVSFRMEPVQGSPGFIDTRLLGRWLEDKKIKRMEKQAFLSWLAGKQWAVVIQFIKEQKEHSVNIALLAEWMDEAVMDRVLSSVSCYTAELLGRLAELLQSEAGTLKGLSGISVTRLSLLIRMAMLRWMAIPVTGDTNPREMVNVFIRILYNEVSGEVNNGSIMFVTDQEIEETISRMSERLHLSGEGKREMMNFGTGEGGMQREDVMIGYLRTLLANKAIDLIEKRRKMACVMEIYRNSCVRLVTLLKEHSLLADCMAVMDRILFEQLVMRLVMQGNTPNSSSYLWSFYRWIWTHDTSLSIFLKGGIVEMKEKMILLLADWAVDGSARNLNSQEVAALFIAKVWGQENMLRVSQLIYQALMQEFSIRGKSGQQYESECLLNLLFRIPGFSIFDVASIESDENIPALPGTDTNLFLQRDFVIWSRHIEKNESNFRLLFNKYLNKPADFIAWLKMDSIPVEFKQKMLQSYTAGHSGEFISLLRECRQDEHCLSILTHLWGISGILEFIGHLSLFKAEVFSQIIGAIQQHPEVLSVIKENGERREEIIIKALWLFLLDEKVWGQHTMQTEEIIEEWVCYLQISYTGKTVEDESEESQWRQVRMLLAGKLEVPVKSGEHPDDKWKSSSIRKEDMIDLLNSPVEKMVLRRRLAGIMEYHSEQFLTFLEGGADGIIAEKCAEGMDHALLERLIILVSASVDRTQALFFRRFMTWIMQHLLDDSSEKILSCLLLSWIQQRGWREKTQEQVRAFFFSRLYDKLQNIPFRDVAVDTDRKADKVELSGQAASVRNGSSPEELPVIKETGISIENWSESVLVNWLQDAAVSISMKQSVLSQCIVRHPGQMLSLVRKLIKGEIIPGDTWESWLDEKDWITMLAGISLYKAELLEQVIEYLLRKQLVGIPVLKAALIRFLIERNPEIWIRETAGETVRRFMQSIDFIKSPSKVDAVSPALSTPEEMMQQIVEELSIHKTESEMEKELLTNAPERIFVGNAGLVLLTPWFPRLFSMLGMLDKENKDFKDMESRIRAIFIIQQLVTSGRKEYDEKELAFNRILVNCPFSEPLPVKMELTENELKTVDFMLNGVKNNWEKVRNVSVRGFQLNFIERGGSLEQKEDKWLLSVDPRPYDMLLDSLPWSYSRVRFPWLKKQIHVSWRKKEEF